MVNTTNDILSLLSLGAPAAPKGASKALDSQGLAGFLNALLGQLQGSTPEGMADIAAQNADVSLQTLAEKISALLQQGAVQPQALQSLPNDKLAEIVTTLLQNNGVATTGIQPSLISDLTASISAQFVEDDAEGIQNLQASADITTDTKGPLNNLIQLLDRIEPGSNNVDAEAAKLIAALKAKIASDKTEGEKAPPAIEFKELKAQIENLKLPSGEIDQGKLETFKADVLKLFKDQGLDDESAIKYTDIVVQNIMKEAVPAAEIPVEQDNALEFMGIGKPKAAPLSPQPKETTPEDLTIIKTKDALLQKLPEHLKTSEGSKEAPAQSNTPREAQSAASQIQSQQQSQQPNNNVTAKVAGFSVNPALINELANGGSQGGADGFGAQPQLQHNNGISVDVLKQTDLGTQNFANYMTNIRHMPSPVTQMVNVQLIKNISSKIEKMTLQLEPADLGRMDIKLEFAKDGGMKAHMTVDKPETLALLQRDAHYLERTLQQAGIDTDEASLSFDLRQQNQQNLEGFDGFDRKDNGGFAAQMNGTAAEAALQAKIAVQSLGYITSSGVNIMV